MHSFLQSAAESGSIALKELNPVSNEKYAGFLSDTYIMIH
ncbi:hypothetical protein RIEGSTA812A_PEG_1293 [invertebrate metagenome]|uniref:Uncharacterized protein n=1 Tax=invertebrate metagenome TaxID=1711999 RepID=A0A484H832_9ZZZZ